MLAPLVAADAEALGQAAAACAANRLRHLARGHRRFAVIFATGASQLATLRALTALPDLPWPQIVAFHLDEYVGLAATHPASFRAYLQRELLSRAPLAEFHPLAADAGDLDAVCRDYACRLAADPPRLGLIGIGENGHLAFNDPGEANFEDPAFVKPVGLDATCRCQQVAEGWFARLEDVPGRALTLTIPAIFAIPELIVSVPGERKTAIVERVLFGPITPACPASVLRRHPNVRLFLDASSAGLLRR